MSTSLCQVLLLVSLTHLLLPDLYWSCSDISQPLQANALLQWQGDRDLPVCSESSVYVCTSLSPYLWHVSDFCIIKLQSSGFNIHLCNLVVFWTWNLLTYSVMREWKLPVCVLFCQHHKLPQSYQEFPSYCLLHVPRPQEIAECVAYHVPLKANWSC